MSSCIKFCHFYKAWYFTAYSTVILPICNINAQCLHWYNYWVVNSTDAVKHDQMNNNVSTQCQLLTGCNHGISALNKICSDQLSLLPSAG